MLVVLLIFRAVLVDLTLMEGAVVMVAVHLCNFSFFLSLLACSFGFHGRALIYLFVWAFIAIVLDILALSLARRILVLTLTVLSRLGREGLGSRGLGGVRESVLHRSNEQNKC